MSTSTHCDVGRLDNCEPSPKYETTPVKAVIIPLLNSKLPTITLFPTPVSKDAPPPTRISLNVLKPENADSDRTSKNLVGIDVPIPTREPLTTRD